MFLGGYCVYLPVEVICSGGDEGTGEISTVNHDEI